MSNNDLNSPQCNLASIRPDLISKPDTSDLKALSAARAMERKLKRKLKTIKVGKTIIRTTNPGFYNANIQ